MQMALCGRESGPDPHSCNLQIARRFLTLQNGTHQSLKCRCLRRSQNFFCWCLVVFIVQRNKLRPNGVKTTGTKFLVLSTANTCVVSFRPFPPQSGCLSKESNKMTTVTLYFKFSSYFPLHQPSPPLPFLPLNSPLVIFPSCM